MDRTELVELIEHVLKNSNGSPDTAGRIADCVMQKYILIHQADDDFDPFNPEHVANFRAMDEHHRKIANIKAIPATGDEIQFKFPGIRADSRMPTGMMYMLAPRRENETDEDWASRCVIITNIGDPKE